MVNGVIDSNAPTSVTPQANVVTQINLGDNESGGAHMYGHIRDLLVWNQTLTDTQVANIRN